MWLFGKHIDLGFLFAPVWLTWLASFLLPKDILSIDIPLWFWVVFVLLIDVGHVWSTLFRTYLEKDESRMHKTVLGLTPIICFVLLFMLASESIVWFWRCMAYLALYHFIKQQYGFFALYTFKARIPKLKKLLNDKYVLYLSMLFPIVYWHFHKRNFTWFVEDGFLSAYGFNETIWNILIIVHWIIILLWVAQEIYLAKKNNYAPSNGRILWLLTTAVNWYLGIVFFNSDIVFTMTNVVAHGIPYLVLIVMYQRTKQNNQRKIPFTQIGYVIILGALFLGYTEEYLWDFLINQEKAQLFLPLFEYPNLDPITQAFFLALLTLPQVVHYVLDGFIWKMNSKNPQLNILFKTNG